MNYRFLAIDQAWAPRDPPISTDVDRMLKLIMIENGVSELHAWIYETGSQYI